MQDIIIRGLCKSFGEKAVLCNVSGTLAAGRITGLMAPSGAGKTTLLRILMGLERADSGRRCRIHAMRSIRRPRPEHHALLL